MKSVMVGTAGHIDHGKTALVKALTGIDTDRLKEEKHRGITIDLGFAHMEMGANGEKLRFGFVDVPGHERFVRNMLAGVGGIDLVLLVIAADEGVKPQTREHFDICRLLSIQRGIAVLTKADLPDPDTLDVVRLEVEDFLRGSFLQNAPIVPVSSLNGSGIEELKRELVRISADVSARDSQAITRLPIDRVFTMKGFGTVVTGTLLAGTIAKEDELEIFPAEKRVRVRGVQVHGSSADRAIAGQRTALNLAGVEKEELARGMMLASSGLLKATSRIDSKLSWLPSATPLKNGARVHLHAFASETIATVKLVDGQKLQPGSEMMAQLRLADPLVLLPGDRFILRQFSPVVTVGGGIVLDANPLPWLKPEIRHGVARVSERGDATEIVGARIARRWCAGITLAELSGETGRTAQALRETLDRLVSSTIAVKIANRYFGSVAVQASKELALSVLKLFHEREPLAPGISQQTLREKQGIDEGLFSFVLGELVREHKAAISGDLVHLSGRGVEMKDEEAESRKTIEDAFASAGLKVPSLKDVLAGLRIDKTRAQKIVTLLLREKLLVKVSDELVFHRAALDQLRSLVAAEKVKNPKLDVARFKDFTGVSRKYAIPLLEYLDRERVTKRLGDERIIL